MAHRDISLSCEIRSLSGHSGHGRACCWFDLVANDPMQTSWVGVPFNYEARLHRGKAQIIDGIDRWKLNGGDRPSRAPSLDVR